MRLLGSFLALSGGLAVAFGTAAFVMALGIVPRMSAVSDTRKRILWYENCVMGGMSAGLLLELCNTDIAVGTVFLVILGLGGGIFFGCWTIALGEILNMYDVLMRRLRIRVGLGIVIWALSLGKTAGILLYTLV